jgi:starch phosphorylase
MELVRHTLASLGPQVQATRMVREYVESHYAPAATSAARANTDGFQQAKDLAAYRSRLDAAWYHIRVTDSELTLPDGKTPVIGERVQARASVNLFGLQSTDVEVQAVVGRVGDTDDLLDVVTVTMQPDSDGTYVAELALPHAGALGYTVRVLPKHDLLASTAELGRVILAN